MCNAPAILINPKSDYDPRHPQFSMSIRKERRLKHRPAALCSETIIIDVNGFRCQEMNIEFVEIASRHAQRGEPIEQRRATFNALELLPGLCSQPFPYRVFGKKIAKGRAGLIGLWLIAEAHVTGNEAANVSFCFQTRQPYFGCTHAPAITTDRHARMMQQAR